MDDILFDPNSPRDKTLGGLVSTPGDNPSPMLNVTVTLDQGDKQRTLKTNREGEYAFRMRTPEPSEIRVSKPGQSSANAGSNVLDIVRMRKHISAGEKLETVEAMIAADVNRDLKINADDMNLLRRVVLKKRNYFSTDGEGNQAPVWRFFDSVGLGQINRRDVFDGSLAGALTKKFGEVSDDILDANFTAIKLGDVNLDYTAPGADSDFGLSRDSLMKLSARESSEEGYTIIDLSLQSATDLSALQFGVQWDSQVLVFDRIETDSLPGFKVAPNTHSGEGFVNVAWDNPTFETISAGRDEVLMSLYLKEVPDASVGSRIYLIEPLVVTAEGYDQALTGIGGYYSAETGTIIRGSKLIRKLNYDYEGSEMRLEIETENGSSYSIEISEDLKEWNQEVVIEGDGFNKLIKVGSDGFRKTFVRVKTVK